MKNFKLIILKIICKFLNNYNIVNNKILTIIFKLNSNNSNINLMIKMQAYRFVVFNK